MACSHVVPALFSFLGRLFRETCAARGVRHDGRPRHCPVAPRGFAPLRTDRPSSRRRSGVGGAGHRCTLPAPAMCGSRASPAACFFCPGTTRAIPPACSRYRIVHPDCGIGARSRASAAPAVAVVGSRAGSAVALETAALLSEDLASRGITVVSGLARGVDSAAHRGRPARRDARSPSSAPASITSILASTPPSPLRSPCPERW